MNSAYCSLLALATLCCTGWFNTYLPCSLLPGQSDEEIHELCALIQIFVSYYLVQNGNEIVLGMLLCWIIC